MKCTLRKKLRLNERTGGRAAGETCSGTFQKIVWQSFLIFYIFLLWFAGFSLVCRRRCWHNIDGLVSLLDRARDEHTINIIGKSVLRRRRCAVDRPPGKSCAPTWINENVCFIRFARRVPTRQHNDSFGVRLPSIHPYQRKFIRYLLGGNWFTRERTRQEQNLKMMMLIIYGCCREK